MDPETFEVFETWILKDSEIFLHENLSITFNSIVANIATSACKHARRQAHKNTKNPYTTMPKNYLWDAELDKLHEASPPPVIAAAVTPAAPPRAAEGHPVPPAVAAAAVTPARVTVAGPVPLPAADRPLPKIRDEAVPVAQDRVIGKNNRNGARNWTAIENEAIVDAVTSAACDQLLKPSDDFWEQYARNNNHRRDGETYLKHWAEMKSAVKSGRSNYDEVRFDSGLDANNKDYFAGLLLVMTVAGKESKACYKSVCWWSLGVVEKMTKLQHRDEAVKCENEVQSGAGLERSITSMKNKYEAEATIREKKTDEAELERKEAGKKKKLAWILWRTQ